MKIVLAPDTFKGSLSAADVAAAMERGIRKAHPNAEILKLPLADGGEGSLDAIISAKGGQLLQANVTGPLRGRITAEYGLFEGGKTAIIEMARAAGLGLISVSERNPRITTTFGVGELFQSALDTGAVKIIIGLGGSCTNDGGAGMVQALGARFIDEDGQSIDHPIGGGDLSRLAHIDLTNFRFPRKGLEVIAASDVTNPLTGPHGASVVYGPQKGATAEGVLELDTALTNYATVIARELNIDVAQYPGAGAAGGLGAALIAFFGAEIRRGIDLVLDLVKFDHAAKDATIVFTGEGRIDLQTINGKLISGLLDRCSVLGVPLVAFTGSVDAAAEDRLLERGILSVVPIMDNSMSLQEAMDSASALVERAAERTARLLKFSVLNNLAGPIICRR